MSSQQQPERIHTVVIGAGQAGLSVGHALQARGVDFVILDANERIGDAWRHRWDSLRLFTAARFDGLAGLPFPAPPSSFPTKDEMADYLESYARHFALPVRLATRVTRLTKSGDGFLVETTRGTYEAADAVVAMATFQVPVTPAFARELDPRIRQIQSLDYRSREQLAEGDVLIVGAGNSGAEIAMDVKGSHRVWLAGRDTGQVPFRIAGLAARLLLERLMLRGIFHRLLTVDTPIGRRVRAKALHRAAPLIRTRRADLTRAGIVRVPRVTGVTAGMPALADGRTLESVRNVIWCAGFQPGFSWIDLPIFDAQGGPRHARGIAADVAGLYFVGLHFLYAFSSTMIHGVTRDAERIASAIAARRSTTPESARRVTISPGTTLPARV
jgi:putative flavoprotein involved in K+ transport